MARFDEKEASFAGQQPNGVRPVGRVRRMIGRVLFVLGTVVIGRDLWLGFFFGSEFGGQERIRLVFWLWAGAVLTLAGCWLGFRLRTAAWRW